MLLAKAGVVSKLMQSNHRNNFVQPVPCLDTPSLATVAACSLKGISGEAWEALDERVQTSKKCGAADLLRV